MLTIVRKGSEVFYNGKKLTIVEQKTKGEGKEVVKIEGLEGSNGQKWVSLSRLKEGENVLECKAREFTITKRSKDKEYELTKEEEAEIQKYQGKINEIIERAKKRYVKVPNLNVDIGSMTPEEKAAKLEEVSKWLEMVRANSSGK